MSYNGIGLSSAKGSGTSGHIQRNIANIRSKENRESKGKHFYNRQLQSSKLESIEKVKKLTNLSIDENIINHELKKELEIKVAEFRDKCEDENPDFDDDQIDKLVDAYRIKLLKSGNRIKAKKPPSYNISINPFGQNSSKQDLRNRSNYTEKDKDNGDAGSINNDKIIKLVVSDEDESSREDEASDK